jgi:hypothetical protein
MDSRLAELYGEQRQSSDYGPAPILSEETPETEENDLVLACAKDTRLELMQSFAEEEVFEPAQRLLMYDRFAVSALEPGVSYPVTAFVTEASVDEVSEFFAKSFGKPIGPVADAAERMQALTERMLALQGPASRGDQDAIAEIQRIGDELAGLQELSTLSSFLQLQAIHAENDLIFLDGTVDDVLERPVRAVTVGSDEAAGGTVIRYINAPNGNGSGRPDPGAGQAGSPGGSGEPAGEGGASERPTAGSDDGCGCSVPGGSSNSSVIAVLPFLAAWLVRRARLRSSR